MVSIGSADGTAGRHDGGIWRVACRKRRGTQAAFFVRAPCRLIL